MGQCLNTVSLPAERELLMLPSFRTISHQHRLQAFFPAFTSSGTFPKQAEPSKPLLNTVFDHPFYHPHCGLPIPGTAQGQAGWGWEHPGTVGDAPAMA